MSLRGVAGVVMVLLCSEATAHEVRTAYLEMAEAEPGQFEVQWKRPVPGGRVPAANPILPEDCEPISAPAPSRTGDVVTERWTTRCGMRTGMIGITGLASAHMEAILRISYLDGDRVEQILRPSSPRLALSSVSYTVGAYFVLGVEHMLFGIDHVLFVVGLVLFIRQPWMLIKTVTAFTAAHSITLGLSVLDLVRLPQGPVEAVIALSILFLARELMVPYRRQSRIMHAAPWMMAFVFGLLHGFGFAGALADIGLPRQQLALSLLLFNVGIEVAQLCVIAVMLAGSWITGRLLQRHTPLIMERSFAAAIGCVAAFWTIDRVVALA